MKSFFSLLLLTATLTAYDAALDWRGVQQDDCYWECLLNVEGRASAIWWKPCGSTFQYGNTTRQTPQETRQLIVGPEYQWGFEILAGVSDPCGCYFANLGWTYLNPMTSVRTRGPDSDAADLFLLSVYTLGGEERALYAFPKQKQHYNKLSLKGGHTICKPRCGCFYTYVGGRWVQIKETRELRSLGAGDVVSTPDIVTRELARFCAGGIEAGIGGDATICQGLGLRGHIGAVALVGRQESQALISFSNQAGPSKQLDPSQTICTGGLEVRGGFYGAVACSSLVFELEIGYELDYYFQTLRFRQPVSSSNNLFCTDIGFGGPYVSLGVSF